MNRTEQKTASELLSYDITLPAAVVTVYAVVGTGVEFMMSA